MSSRGLPSLQGEGGLSRYLTEIRKFPLLAPEEEYMLAKRWKAHEDPEAARKLVTSQLRLVAKIAMGYRGYGLPVSEIVASPSMVVLLSSNSTVSLLSLNRPARLIASWLTPSIRQPSPAMT